VDISDYRFDGKNKFKLKDCSTCDTGKFSSRKEAEKVMRENIVKMIELQAKLYADNHYAILIIFQAMDTAGKDGAIRHVMSGLNPQGSRITVFKKPSTEELDHDYLWKAHKNLPQRGQIGIFNRSYYEEVLVVRVHNLLSQQNLPQKLIKDSIWRQRYRQINDFEKYLTENAVIPLKFFLHISRKEQKQRLLKRIDDPSRNWKFSGDDIKERQYWDEYQKCYEEAIGETGTELVPWYIIPSDKKWFARLAISDIIVKTLESLQLGYPKLNKEQMEMLAKSRQVLLRE
jgi:PPK2 family polyphosphate:nucleotide phosphotransferase